MKHTEINTLYWYWYNLNTGSTIDYLPQVCVIGLVTIVIAFSVFIWRNRANLKPINKCAL